LLRRLWGGWTKEKILAIMRDSRTGAFGVVALIMTLGLKWQAIASLPRVLVPLLLLASQTISRSGAVSLMAALDYAGSEDGKARPLSSRMGTGRLFATLVFGLAPYAWLRAALLVGWRSRIRGAVTGCALVPASDWRIHRRLSGRGSASG